MGTGFCGSNKTMPKIVAALLLLLLVLENPAPSSARFIRKLTSVSPTRHVSESTLPEVTKPGTFRADLMSPYHVNSPYAQPNLTLSQRMEIAATSSRARARYFASKIEGKQARKAERKLIYSSPLYSGAQDGYDNYIMEVALGTPASTFLVVADTGSDLAWVQCQGCASCITEPDPVFDPSASSSYSSISCTDNFCVDLGSSQESCSSTQTCLYEYGYGDKSETKGDLALETITLTTTTASQQPFSGFVFGCGTNNTGIFKGVDGLFGLGRGELSLVSQLGSQFNNVFSYCLVDFDSATTVTSSLLFGSVGDPALQLIYTPLISNPLNPGHYYVNVVGITVNDQQLDYPADTFTINSSTGNGGFILDSGTTLTQLAAAAYNSLLTALSSLISYPPVDESSNSYDLCYDISNVDSPSFPTVVFQFDGGLEITLPDNNVFAQLTGDGAVCLAMQSTPFGLSIFGNIQQQNFQIAYDNGNNQVGFASTTCSS